MVVAMASGGSTDEHIRKADEQTETQVLELIYARYFWTQLECVTPNELFEAVFTASEVPAPAGRQRLHIEDVSSVAIRLGSEVAKGIVRVHTLVRPESLGLNPVSLPEQNPYHEFDFGRICLGLLTSLDVVLSGEGGGDNENHRMRISC